MEFLLDRLKPPLIGRDPLVLAHVLLLLPKLLGVGAPSPVLVQVKPAAQDGVRPPSRVLGLGRIEEHLSEDAQGLPGRADLDMVRDRPVGLPVMKGPFRYSSSRSSTAKQMPPLAI